jgi:hypothetical protein
MTSFITARSQPKPACFVRQLRAHRAAAGPLEYQRRPDLADRNLER